MDGVLVREPARPENRLNLARAVAALRRGRLVILFAALVGLAAGLAYALTAPAVYQATALVRVQERPAERQAIDVLRPLIPGGEGEVSTEIEVLRGWSLAADVVDSLNLHVVLQAPRDAARQQLLSDIRAERDAPPFTYRMLRRSPTQLVVENVTAGGQIGVFTPGSVVPLNGAVVTLAPESAGFEEARWEVVPFRDAAESLWNSLSVDRPNRDASLITITYTGKDPLLVGEVPNTLAALFIARRQEALRTEARSTARFLRARIDTIAQQLAGAEEVLRDFREREQVVDIETEAAAQVGQLSQLQAQRNAIDAERAALARLVDQTAAAAPRADVLAPSPYRRLIAFPTLLRNQAASELLRSVAQVEDQRAELLALRTPEDPDVEALTARIRELEAQLGATAMTYLQGLTNQVAALDATLARFGREVGEIPGRQIDLERLQRVPRVLEETYTVLLTRLREAEIAEAVEDATVRLVDPAIVPVRPVAPNRPLIVVAGLMAGLFLGVLIALLREFRDRRIRTPEQLQASTGGEVPVLGLVPHFAAPARPPTDARRRLGADGAEVAILPADLVEPYRSLWARMKLARPDGEGEMFLVTGAAPEDGASTTARNIARLLGRERRVLLIDGDLRGGANGSADGTSPEVGLSDLVAGHATLEQVVVRLHEGKGAALHLLGAGTPVADPGGFASSPELEELLGRLRSLYDAVIIDGPPLTTTLDAAVLGTRMHGILLVVRAGVTDARTVQDALEQLRLARASLMGSVLNDVPLTTNGAG